MSTDDKIYEGQTGLQVILDCVVDVSAASQYRIYYEKPDGSTGYASATLLGGTTTDIYFVVTDDEFLDQSGVWKFHAWVYWAADDIVPGNVVKRRVYKVGT